jgi:hypothetical protein
MAIGQLTGVRGLQTWRFTQAIISAKSQNVFASEVAGTLDGKPLVKVASAIDAVAAKKQNASWRQEHTDAYCLARDFKYAHRSRKWLAAKALRTTCDHAYEEYASFLRENVILQPELDKLPGKDVAVLAATPFSDILKP